MIQTLLENWWLLFLRGLLALSLSIMAFLTRSTAETFTLRPFAAKGIVVLLGVLATTAGACTAAAGIWKASKRRWWLLAVDGIAVMAAGFALILSDHFSFYAVTRIVVALAAA